MTDFVDYIAMFVKAVALIMSLVLMISLLERRLRIGLAKVGLTGLLFSFAIFLTISDPIDLGPGGIHDLRSLLIGAATGLLGPLVGGMTLATGLLTRWEIGGPGMVPGFLGMVVTYVAAMLWRYTVDRTALRQSMKGTLLGVFISFHLVGFFLFPAEIWKDLLPRLAPYYFAANVLGLVLVSHLIRGELSFLSEVEASRVEANTDHLTGLLNRRGLNMIYPDRASAVTGNRGRALLYFDIDNFKTFNDIYGHKIGDTVLKHVADTIAINLRPDDIFARLGGDEFAIVLNNIDEAGARHIAERCRGVVNATDISTDDDLHSVSISIGGVWMLGHSEIDDILDTADQALYQAKTEGRNRVVFTDKALPSGNLLTA